MWKYYYIPSPRLVECSQHVPTRHHTSFWFSRVICLILAGCTLMMKSIQADDTPSAKHRRDSANLCVILIGGIDSDPSPNQMAGRARRGEGQSGLYQLANDIRAKGLAAEYFNWNGTRAGHIKEQAPQASGIVQVILDHQSAHPQDAFAIVANSWGGHTAWEVCQSLEQPAIPLEAVVFLDPSSMARSKSSRPSVLPSCVKSGKNYYTRNVFGWREWPGEPRLTNIDLGDKSQGYLIDGGPRYDSSFDIQAHISAEWDPRIHQAITTYLVDLQTQKTTVEAGK